MCRYTPGVRGIGADGRVIRSKKEKAPGRYRNGTNYASASSASSQEDVSTSAVSSRVCSSIQPQPGPGAPQEWMHVADLLDYRFGSGSGGDGNSSNSSGGEGDVSEEDIGSLNEEFVSMLGLTGIYSRRPSTITIPSPPPSSLPPSPSRRHSNPNLSFSGDPSTSTTNARLSPLASPQFCDLTPRIPWQPTKMAVPWVVQTPQSFEQPRDMRRVSMPDAITRYIHNNCAPSSFPAFSANVFHFFVFYN